MSNVLSECLVSRRLAKCESKDPLAMNFMLPPHDDDGIVVE